MLFTYLKYIAQMIYIGLIWDVALIQILMKNKITCPTFTGKTFWVLISTNELCMQRQNGAHWLIFPLLCLDFQAVCKAVCIFSVLPSHWLYYAPGNLQVEETHSPAHGWQVSLWSRGGEMAFERKVFKISTRCGIGIPPLRHQFHPHLSCTSQNSTI